MFQQEVKRFLRGIYFNKKHGEYSKYFNDLIKDQNLKRVQ